MAQVLVNFRMDAEDKKGMEEVCKELGLSMSTAFTIFAKKMRRERRIPFDVSVDPFYSEANISYLKDLTAEIDSGYAVLAEHSLKEDYSDAIALARERMGRLPLVANTGQENTEKNQCLNQGYTKKSF